jgi:hypothetical protein
MKEVKFDHIFNCDADTYWDRIFFEEAFNNKLFHDTLKFNEWRAEITRQDDAVIKRTVTVRPPVGDVPGAVKKVLGDNFGYKEHGTFDKKTKRYHVDIDSNVAAEKTHIHGDIWLEKSGDKKVRRLATFKLEVKIMVVGKLVEDIIAKDMIRSFERGAQFTNEWIKDKGL